MTDKITRFFKENDKTLSAKQVAARQLIDRGYIL